MAAIDLRPYGLDWTLDPAKMTEPIPARYNIARVTRQSQGQLVFSLPDWPAPKIFNMTKRLGEKGTFGNTWLTNTVSGSDTIIKVIDNSAGDLTDKDVVLESVIQIIIEKTTEHESVPEINLVGPFCPRLYLIGKSASTYYLVMEKMKETIYTSLWSSADKPSLIRYYFCQIAKIAGILNTKLQFNHRDFKTDNIMYTHRNGVRQVRYIDFGFSCLKYNGMPIITPNYYVKQCNLPSRDMNSLLYNYFIVDYSQVPPREWDLKNIAKILLAYYPTRPSSWRNTYTFYNTQPTNPNTTPDAILNLFKHIRFDSDVWNTRVKPSWAKSLVEINDSMVNRLSDLELVEISEPVLQNYGTRGSARNILRIFNCCIKSNKLNLGHALFQYTPGLVSSLTGATAGIFLKSAIKQNNKELILRLLEVPNLNLYADIDELHEPNLLFTVAKQPTLDPFIKHILFKLLAADQATLQQTNDLGQTSLMLAAYTKNIEFVKAWLLLPKKLTAQRDNKGNTVLHYATRNKPNMTASELADQSEIVNLLIDANPALMYIRNREGWGFQGQRPNSKLVAGVTPLRNTIKIRRRNQNRRGPVVNTNKAALNNTRRRH
jgi:serine/threonine protein kinase